MVLHMHLLEQAIMLSPTFIVREQGEKFYLESHALFLS